MSSDGDRQDEGADAEEGVGFPPPTPLPRALSAAVQADLTSAARHDWIGEAGRPDRSWTSDPDRRVVDVWASTTDPDASSLRPTGGAAHLGYRDHDVDDEGKARIVLTILVSPAEVQDNHPALDLRWRARFRWKIRPRQVTGDSRYGTADNVVATEFSGPVKVAAGSTLIATLSA